MRVGTIDIGTNTVLLLIAESGAQESGGSLVAVEEHATITRLGQGVDRTRRLSDEAIARTRECLERYSAIVWDARVDAMDIVGTSAMRDAEGGVVIVEACRALFGVPARVLSGDEEADVTFRGSLSGIQGLGNDVCVFDIGGGSTEVVFGRPGDKPRFAKSFDVGSVRLTERIAPSDPPTPNDLESLDKAAKALLADCPRAAAEATAVGIAGTMTTLTAVHLGLETYDGSLVHGATLTLRELETVVTKLAALPLAERSLVHGLEPKRADVIVAGGFVALAVLRALGKDSVRISDRGVRWGLAAKLVAGGHGGV
jgi:exopolyphosphatase / guanosine-5'-triphosphate,3'-diphosphate pyrophosphatase